MRDEPRPLIRQDIQGLRAVAVLLVIGNHAHVPGFGGGYAGVDVFFVVSGYVITQLLLRETAQGVGRGLVDFYARRVRRVVPAASATLVVTVLAARVVLGGRFDPALLGDVRWAAVFGANLRLISAGSNYFVPGIAPSLVTQFWSLAVEEQFYLLFPLLVLSTARGAAARGRAHLPVLLLVLLPAIAASAWWSAHSSATEPAVAYFSPSTRFWELGVGCLLAIACSGTARPGVRWSPVVATAGVVGLVLTMVVLPGAVDYPGTLAWLPVSSTACLLWAGQARPRFPSTRILSSRVLTTIGDRSYSLYLWHWLWIELPQQVAVPPTGWGWRIVELAGIAVTAAVSYRWLENPVRRSRRLADDPVAAALLLAVCVVAVWTMSLLVARFTPSS
jgi:peptidoglycan/LPS O-acetylase OafA/YrhL